MGSHGASWGGAAYDRARESFSNPLMRRCESQYRFATLKTYPDGVTSDFHFAAEQDALHAWRYPDLTTHVRYFSDLLRDTVDHEMAREAAALRDNGTASSRPCAAMAGPQPANCVAISQTSLCLKGGCIREPLKTPVFSAIPVQAF